MVENVDLQIGRLIDLLESSGKLKNTFLLFTSDNGGLYSITKQWPLRAGKGSVYEGGIRVPMFAFWEGEIAEGTESDVPISNLDFFPTILDVARISKPAGKNLDGQSIISVLTGKGSMRDRPLFWHFPIYLEGGNVETQDTIFRTRPGSCIRLGDWKLIQYFEANDLELYNLKEDIGEKINLAKSNPGKTKELLGELEEWRKNTHAPVPNIVNPDYIAR